MHEILVNRLGGLSLLRKKIVLLPVLSQLYLGFTGYVLYVTKYIYCLRFVFFSYFTFPKVKMFCCLLDSDNRIWEYIVNNHYTRLLIVASFRGGRVVRWCWVNFQGRGVMLVWVVVGQGGIAFAVGAGWGCLDVFVPIYLFPSFSLSGRRSDID